MPRDRERSFEPQLIKKQQARPTGMDDKILFLYIQEMTTREICTAFKELFDADVSASFNEYATRVSSWMAVPAIRPGIHDGSVSIEAEVYVLDWVGRLK